MAQGKTKPKTTPNSGKKKPASGATSAPKPPQNHDKKPAAANKETVVLSEAAKRQRTAIILFTASAFFFCIAAIKGQSVWLQLHEALFGLFGFCAWAIPVLLLALCIVFALNKPLGSMTSAFICVGIFVVFLSGIVHVGMHDEVYLNSSGFGLQISDAWNYESIAKNGGILGVLVGASITKIFGKVPAMITMILILFLTFMFFSGTTLVALFHTVTVPVKKVGNIADARIEQGIKRHEENEAERERRRREKAEASGAIETEASKESDNSKKFNPNIDVGPDASPKLDYDKNDNFLPDYIYADNERGTAEIASKLKPPVLITSPPIDTAVAAEELKPTKKRGKAKSEEAASDAQQSESTEPDDLQKPDEVVFDSAPVYRKPPITCLSEPALNREFGNIDEIEQNSALLIKTLESFGVKASITDVCRGPSVTRYELLPAEGVKISKITSLSDDISMRLAASGVRIEAPIPNKAAIGIEVPNKAKASVVLREIIDTDVFRRGSDKSLLNVALGKDITGNIICADLAKMPHLLIAGTTGSGKSVCINSMIMSILFNARPDEVRLIMIDPKQVEFTVYSGIPHLLVPVVSDVRKAAGVLGWAVSEMLRRYKLLSEKGTRDITGYNKLAEKDPEMEKMNRVVIFIDELSDLMMVAQNEVEDAICRLAQMARAAGMHLVIATQRPSVDVITGVIKANIPSRIALSVSSQIDSRTIIDMAGAEKLLGYGDMLFNPVGISKPMRVQGCFVSDGEVESVVDFIKNQSETVYDEDIMDEIDHFTIAKKKSSGTMPDEPNSGSKAAVDEKLQKAIEVVVETQMASTTLLQRKLGLGYARAARLIDELYERKIVGPFEGSKPRKVLISKQQWMEMCALSGDDAIPDVSEEVNSDADDTDDNIV